MPRFLSAILAFLLLLSSLAYSEGEKQLYMLSAVYAQETRLPRAWVLGTWGVDAAWDLSQAGLYFHLTGDPYGAAAVFTYESGSSVALVTANLRAQMQGKAWWDRRKFLKEVAKLEGVEDLHVFTASELENASILNKTLRSRSIVFIEKNGGETPKPVQGMNWIKVENLEAAKIRMHLDLGGMEAGIADLEIPLKDFLAGHRMDSALRKEWIDKIEEFEKQASWWNRYFRHGHVQNMRVRSSLIMGEMETDLGEVAVGKGVKKLVGITWKQNLMRGLRKGLGREVNPNPVFGSRHSTVYTEEQKKAGCGTWFARLMGREFVR